MTKKILAAVLAWTLALTISAVPARHITRRIVQPDGSVIEVYQRGDEHHHYYTNLEGRLLTLTDNGFLRLATDQEADELDARGQEVRRREAARQQAIRQAGRRKVFPTKGDQRSIVILAEFSDNSFASPTAHTDFEALLNEPGYSQYGGTGSARDYFRDQSMGLFNPTFDVYGPVKLSRPIAYYGKNKGTGGDDEHATDMIVEVCRILDDEIDFSQYDYNNDGFIDNVFVYYAGFGEATLGDANTIWPHSYDITSVTTTPVLFDGVQLDHYACTNEIGEDYRMDGIGTFVHEFSHVLGLPDLYDTGYASSHPFTPGRWSVIDEGEYNNVSRTPPCYTAYERMAVGWLTPYELNGAANMSLSTIGEANEACIIRTSSENEYYLLENRQNVGWDRYIPGHGMLIWHIDYDPFIWEQNRVNNTSSHQRVDIIEADGILTDATRGGDAFPGTMGVTEFTKDTDPAMFTWIGQTLDMPITEIIENADGTVSFKVCGGTDALLLAQQTPVLHDPAEVTPHSFLAQWDAVPGANGYRLSVFSREKGEPGTQVVDFTGGLAQMPEGWQTNSSSTYAMKSYCGESAPSLRLQQDGHFLQSPVFEDDLLSLTFWHRGVSSSADNALLVYALAGVGTPTLLDTPAIVNEAGGATLTYAPLPAGTRAVRMEYKAVGSGSVTIDDVRLQHQGETHIIPLPGYESLDCRSALSQRVDGLTEGLTYYYTIQAYNSATQSLVSAERSFLAGSASVALTPVLGDPTGIPAFTPTGLRVSPSYKGLTIQAGRKIIRK